MILSRTRTESDSNEMIRYERLMVIITHLRTHILDVWRCGLVENRIPCHFSPLHGDKGQRKPHCGETDEQHRGYEDDTQKNECEDADTVCRLWIAPAHKSWSRRSVKRKVTRNMLSE